MAVIENVKAVPTLGGGYFDDQEAIRAGAEQDGVFYKGPPVIEGYKSIREPGEAISIVMELSDGQVGYGDCTAVVFSGAGGRDPLFRAREYAPLIRDKIADVIVGQSANAVEENLDIIEEMESPKRPGKKLHTAIRYGISQALVDVAAIERNTTKATILANLYGTKLATDPIPVYGQSGGDHHIAADKMILKGTEVLPHGSFHNKSEFGSEGENLLNYLEWLSGRISKFGKSNYNPKVHIDVYGQIGELFGQPYDRSEVLEFFSEVRSRANPYEISIEAPIHENNRNEQIEAMKELKDGLEREGINVQIGADEWCNTLEDIKAFVDAEAADLLQVKTPDLGGIQRSVEAVLYCRGTGTSAFIGGSANETDRSARVCAHVALATKPAFLTAKPGTGVDEGIMIVTNEMRRTLARQEI